MGFFEKCYVFMFLILWAQFACTACFFIYLSYQTHQQQLQVEILAREIIEIKTQSFLSDFSDFRNSYQMKHLSPRCVNTISNFTFNADFPSKERALAGGYNVGDIIWVASVWNRNSCEISHMYATSLLITSKMLTFFQVYGNLCICSSCSILFLFVMYAPFPYLSILERFERKTKESKERLTCYFLTNYITCWKQMLFHFFCKYVILSRCFSTVLTNIPNSIRAVCLCKI